CCLVGCLPIFQANQLTQILFDVTIMSPEWKAATLTVAGYPISTAKLVIGVVLMTAAGIVILGGIKRIGYWAGNMVPLMVVVYFFSVLVILILNFSQVPEYFLLIFTDAFAADHFNGDAALGGVLGGLIVTGVRRASFSN